MNKDKIYKIDIAVIGVSLLVIAIAIGYVSPMIISPPDDLVSSNGSVLFSFEKADYILIDDNQEFSSPEKIYVGDNLVLNLNPGTYYWEIVGVLRSEIRKLTINSRVDLKFEENADGFDVVNAGNTRLLVDIYNGTNIIGKTVLDVGEETNETGDKYLGRQYE